MRKTIGVSVLYDNTNGRDEWCIVIKLDKFIGMLGAGIGKAPGLWLVEPADYIDNTPGRLLALGYGAVSASTMTQTCIDKMIEEVGKIVGDRYSYDYDEEAFLLNPVNKQIDMSWAGSW